MLDSDIPVKIPVPFASSATSGFIRAIPVTSGDPDAASFTLGFPPDVFAPVNAGGAPPDGRDFNGIHNQQTAWLRWIQAGGPIAYDATFQAAVGGYMNGAVVASATIAGVFWRSTADANTTDPDAGGAGWVDATINPKVRIVTASATLNLDCGNDLAVGLARTSAPAAMIVNLAATGVLIPGKLFRISDLAKNFSRYKVTVVPPAGHNIADDSQFVMNADKQSASFLYYGSLTWDVQSS